MEALKAFNEELSSVQDTKGPISRAKMGRLTSIAIKAVKFYKHVVHSVEKFIQKGDMEHKIPGLYVMDSIIRQSIHRFGPEKDVFASRFSKNVFGTFQHLLQCKEDDKVKIVRVLQLWQKNAVFSNDVIQQLLDLIQKSSEECAPSDNPQADVNLEMNDNENVAEVNAQDDSKILNNAMQINQLLQQVASNHPQLLPQLSQIIQLSQNQSALHSSSEHQPRSNPVPEPLPSASTSNFHALSSAFGSTSREENWTVPQKENPDEGQFSDSSRMQSWLSESLRLQREAMSRGGNSFGNHLVHSSDDSQHQHGNNYMEREEGEMWDDEELNHCHKSAGGELAEFYNNSNCYEGSYESKNYTRKRRRSVDRASNERSQRSRSREKRRRSRSRERSYRRSNSRERQRREVDRSRRQLGLPAIETNHVLICSTTLWIGHLNKHTTEQELRMELSNYGTISSLNLIPPRGCAFVTFSTRKEAQKALDRMKGKKFNNYVLKLAWAIGSGMKESEFKEFWNLEQGTSHIPWSKLDDTVDLDVLAEGGFLDEESLPQDLLKALMERRQSIPAEVATDAEKTSAPIPESKPFGAPPVIPPCFPMSHLPPPLPGMPPLLPPPPGMMLPIPPPIIPPGAPAPLSIMSPNQGNQSEGATPTSVGTPGKPRPDVHIPPPSFPPPPLPGWSAPGMRPLPPPMSFPPPPMPMRPQAPLQPLIPTNEPEVKGNENLEAVNEPEFNSHQGHAQTPFGGQLRPPPFRGQGPWTFNNRGPRAPPRYHHHHHQEDDFYRDGGQSFTPTRFNPRFRHDGNQPPRGNWGRGNFRRNFKHWSENSGEEHREEFCPEGERYYEPQRNDYWNRDHREFPRHQDQRWNRRNNRWGNEDQAGGFQRGRARWHEGNQDRDNQRWNRGHRGNQNRQWTEQRQHQEEGNFKAQEMFSESGEDHSAGNADWGATNNGGKSQDVEPMLNESFREGRPNLTFGVPVQEEAVKKRTKRSRWDTDSDQPASGTASDTVDNSDI